MIKGGIYILNPNLPKYVAIAGWMKENIYNQTYKAGEKLISEHQLCEKFSISRQTARQAISILEKEGLVIKKQGSGTYINQIFSEMILPSKTIGLLLPSLDNPISSTIISGVEEILSQYGYHTALRLTRNKINTEREQLLSLLQSNIEGLIVEGTKSALPNPNLDLYKKFEERQIPVLFINSYYPQLNCHYIKVDDEKGGEIVTRYLIENGHQNITGIFKYDELQANLRYKGFLTEMYRHHLSVDESAMTWYSTENMEQQFSSENLTQLLKKFKTCTAVICYSDEIALKLIQLLSQTLIELPQHLSLISFDNSILSNYSTPSLTSLTHPKEELGHLAAHSILKLINHEINEIKHTYLPELKIRNSVSKR